MVDIFDIRTGEIIHTIYLLSDDEEISDEECFELAIDCGHNPSEKKYWRVRR